MNEEDHAFLNLILMLGTVATQRLEGLASPVSANPEIRNELIPKTRETINMLQALKKRTQGRLTDDEARVLDTLLRNLQMKYVQVLGLPGIGGKPDAGGRPDGGP